MRPFQPFRWSGVEKALAPKAPRALDNPAQFVYLSIAGHSMSCQGIIKPPQLNLYIDLTNLLSWLSENNRNTPAPTL